MQRIYIAYIFLCKRARNFVLVQMGGRTTFFCDFPAYQYSYHALDAHIFTASPPPPPAYNKIARTSGQLIIINNSTKKDEKSNGQKERESEQMRKQGIS